MDFLWLHALDTAVPFFTQVDTTPDYFANTTAKVTTVPSTGPTGLLQD